MKNNYTYPAKITKKDGELSLQFLDFENSYVVGDDMEDLIESAQDELALLLIDILDRGENVPEASMDKKCDAYINVWLPYYRSVSKEVYIKKTLTIPAYLDILAKEKNINFSATLVKALKQELGLNN